MDIKDILKDFMLIPAPSGYESAMAYKLKERFELYCDDVYLDNIGNCIGYLRGTDHDPMKVMVFAHMDQLGFIVRKIEADGYIQVDRLGGVTEKVLPGLELLIRDEDGGWHPGLFGVKSHHAMSDEEKYRVDPVTSMFIDLGKGSKEEVNQAGIHEGCPVVYRPSFNMLSGTKASGTSVDDRGGCACLVEIASKISKNRPPCDIYLVGTVWEEFNLRGAMLAARKIKPDAAISIDVTLAGDTNDLKTRFDTRLGAGPCLQLYSFHGRGTLNGSIANEPLFKIAKTAAKEMAIPFQRFSALGLLTDTSYLQLENDGIACLEMGFPARYTHTPVEVCDINDLLAISDLIPAMFGMMNKNIDLKRY